MPTIGSTRSLPQIALIGFRGVNVAQNRPMLRWKRRAIWANVGRNSLIARVAQALVATDRNALRNFGLNTLNASVTGGDKFQVAILVEGVDHARHLHKLLGDWQVLDTVRVSQGLGWEFDVPELDYEPPVGVIATLMYAVRCGLRCDVMIRATGGTGKLNWSSFHGGRNGRPDLLIDIYDQSGEREQVDSETRRREYWVQGIRE